MVRMPEELAACKTVCDLLSGKTHRCSGYGRSPGRVRRRGAGRGWSMNTEEALTPEQVTEVVGALQRNDG